MKYFLVDKNNNIHNIFDFDPHNIYPDSFADQFLTTEEDIDNSYQYLNGEFVKKETIAEDTTITDIQLALTELYEQNLALTEELEALNNG